MLSVKRGRPTSKAKNYVECVDNKRVKCAFCLRLLSNATNRIKSHLIKTCKLCPMDIKQYTYIYTYIQQQDIESIL
jgi:ribosomal protein L37AE/L43A